MPAGGQHANRQWANAPRVAHGKELVARQDDQRISSLPALHGILDALEPIGAGRAGQHHGNHLAVGAGGETHPIPQHPGAQLGGVDQVAVVRHGDRSVLCLNEERLGIAQRRRAGRGVAHVTQGEIALQTGDAFRRKDLRNQAGILVHVNTAPVRYGNSGGLLAAMLQCIQAEEGHARHIFSGRIDAQHAAFFLRVLVGQPIDGSGAFNHAVRRHPAGFFRPVCL